MGSDGSLPLFTVSLKNLSVSRKRGIFYSVGSKAPFLVPGDGGRDLSLLFARGGGTNRKLIFSFQ